MSRFFENVVGKMGDKQRWKDYKARVAALPELYRSSVNALERYLARVGGVADGDAFVAMHEEVVGAFETAACVGTSVGDVVVGDPVGYADGLVARYRASDWLDAERARLTEAFASAAQHGSRA